MIDSFLVARARGKKCVHYFFPSSDGCDGSSEQYKVPSITINVAVSPPINQNDNQQQRSKTNEQTWQPKSKVTSMVAH
jgi:hypothetical protein